MISSLPVPVLRFLDIAFFAVHSALVVFNLIGWAFPRTRKLHLICIAATLFSWLVMGATHGFGYCLFTDWHFQIRRQLGLPVEGHTYLQLMAQVFFGAPMSRLTSDVLAVGGLLLVLILTLIVWVRGMFKTRLPS